ncbi:phosphotransferase [Cytobacillus dafuensis]|uniref:Phosphotransferase n=1 Tax=Cytobacillus dafuensis TaxID=1742359 RepID=A0A5B8ZFA2_CYTDA|nr:phosphotransferase [Cytobacillus dafuensis]QED50186.1 phosphotransferase [Cytobacillus dafuensis]
MAIKKNNGGDDLFVNRLFSYLQKQLTIQIDEIIPIRKHVYFVKSKETNFILKGYSSNNRLLVQNDFLTALKQEGFEKTYSFYQLAKKPPLHFGNLFYGCLEYIHPSEKRFTYHSREDQLEGLEVLSQFHELTENLIHRFERIIPSFKQLEKWKERSAMFMKNLHVLRYYVQKEILNEVLYWADWSIKGIQVESNFFQAEKKVILHGDVAHHNFLRSKNDIVYLIDFDLISIGNPITDLLQYANRILPFLNWSLPELSKYERFSQALKEKGFLYALAYPTDIFREWNRAIRERSYFQPEKMKQLFEITIGQFKERKEFFQALQEKVLEIG